jgi:hypothetical protein
MRQWNLPRRRRRDMREFSEVHERRVAIVFLARVRLLDRRSTATVTTRRSIWSPRVRAREMTYVRLRFFLLSAKSLLNNALLGFDSFYNAA